MVQGLRIALTQVQSLVQNIPCVTRQLSLCATTAEPMYPRARAPQQEEPPQEKPVNVTRVAPARRN